MGACAFKLVQLLKGKRPVREDPSDETHAPPRGSAVPSTGAKPRRAVLTGVDALTASELRVAELAAQGLTNREIAQALAAAKAAAGRLTGAVTYDDFQKVDLVIEAAVEVTTAGCPKAHRRRIEG